MFNWLTMDVDGTAGTLRPPSENDIAALIGTASAVPAPNPRATTAAPRPNPNLLFPISISSLWPAARQWIPVAS
jgi:hypothetical protein